MYNLFSIGIGLLGWCLAIIGIRRHGSRLLGYLSMSACSLAMLTQFVEYKRLVNIEDISAILDTAGGRVFGAVVLVSVTLFLNGLNLWIDRTKTPL